MTPDDPSFGIFEWAMVSLFAVAAFLTAAMAISEMKDAAHQQGRWSDDDYDWDI